MTVVQEVDARSQAELEHERREGKEIVDFWKENSIRRVLHEMVEPLIRGQQNNQTDVSKTLEELKVMREIHEETMT